MQELEQIKVREMQLLETKMRKDLKKQQKEKSLIAVLQLKARDAILKQLEKEKEIRLKE
jgi:hypothetical protein